MIDRFVEQHGWSWEATIHTTCILGIFLGFFWPAAGDWPTFIPSSLADAEKSPVFACPRTALQHKLKRDGQEFPFGSTFLIRGSGSWIL